jgi:hypothetical protein
MSKFPSLFMPLIMLTILGHNSMQAQTTNAAPYCQYNANKTVQGRSGAISKVTLGTLNNATTFGNMATGYNSTNGSCAQLYTYYNNIAAPSLTTGSNYTIDLEFKSWFDGEPVWYAAYIDFNQNNVFDTTSEMIIDMAHADVLGFIPRSTTPSILTATRSNSFVVPANAVPGTTRMRVIRSHKDYAWADSVSKVNPCAGFTPTNNWSFGEVEDYNITIVAANTATPSVVSLTSNTVTHNSAVLTGVVNANNTTAAISFEYGTTIAYGSNLAATPASVTGAANTTVTSNAIGLLPNTTYHYRIKATVGTSNYYSADSTFKTKTITGIEDTEADNEIKIYPNPSKGEINIEMPVTSSPVTINLFNIAGALVYTSKGVINGVKTIRPDGLPDGLYHIQISCGDKIYRKSINIIH